MPVCTLHLLALQTPISTFLSALSTTSLDPLVASRVVRWIITPRTLSADPLLSSSARWDVLLILPTADTILPAPLTAHIRARWTVKAGVPSRLIANFRQKNSRLLHPRDGDVPPLTGALEQPRIADSAQALELTDELRDWIKEFGEEEGQGAVSMLNLLAFRDGMKEEYLKYGAAFAESIGSRRGGDAKIVGTVVEDGGGKGCGGDGRGGKVWDEIALAHYPSIWHFADMLASEDYQVVNKQYRVGSLKDTFILCTTELGLSSLGGAERNIEGAAAKL